MEGDKPTDPSAKADRPVLPTAATAGVAASLARSPLGIIALFIVLVDSIACITVFALKDETGTRTPFCGTQPTTLLILFIVLFPCLVFAAFAYLVRYYPRNLYGPGDFKDERNFLRLLGIVDAAHLAFKRLAPDVSDSGLPSDLNVSARLQEARRGIEEALGLPPSNDQHIPTLPKTPPKAVAKRVSRVRSAVAPGGSQEDPNKGKFGGKRQNERWKVEVIGNEVRPLQIDPDWFQLRLLVSALPGSSPGPGDAIFHLHPDLPQPVLRKPLVDGKAELALITSGAFTLGVVLPGNTTLEIDLADTDINSPQDFKDR